MHIIDYGIGVMLQELADLKESQDYSKRIIKKLRTVACEHFKGAEKALPTHEDTINRIINIESYQQQNMIPYLQEKDEE